MVKHSKITKVFQLSLVIIFILVLLGLFVPQQFQNISSYLKNLLTTSVGWFYLLLVTGILIFCVFLIVSPIGQIRLGNPTSRPEHSTTSWIAMMFSAGMGIGLVWIPDSIAWFYCPYYRHGEINWIESAFWKRWMILIKRSR